MNCSYGLSDQSVDSEFTVEFWPEGINTSVMTVLLYNPQSQTARPPVNNCKTQTNTLTGNFQRHLTFEIVQNSKKYYEIKGKIFYKSKTYIKGRYEFE